jgi:CBS domain-containing protein
MEPLEFVAVQPPFDRLDSADLELLGRSLEGVYFPAGTRILEHDGPPSSHVHLVRKGSVRLIRDGRELWIVEEGELFGHPSVLSGNPPSADVVAAEDVLAYRIPSDVFTRLAGRAEIAEFFFESLAERLRRSEDTNVASLGGNLANPVDSLITRPPLFVDPQDPVSHAAGVMRDTRASSVLVSGDPLGIVTDRDLRSRVVAASMPFDTAVSAVMTKPLKTIPADSPLYAALLFMLEENIHHVPVMREGRIVGVVTDTDLLRHQQKSPLYVLKRVQKIGSQQEASAYASDIAAMVEGLLTGGLNVGQIGRVIASLNDALTNRLLRLAEHDLGTPPSRYAWVVFGSEGRLEQLLLTDQDNALIFEEDSAGTRTYFTELAERVIGGLLAAGFPKCPGGFTADRLLWSLGECKSMFESWVAAPRPESLLDASVLLDFRSVHETMSLQPLNQIVTSAHDNDLFMAHLAREALRFAPPLTLFRGIKVTGGSIDIKKGGISPIVGLGRLYGMLAGSFSRPTTERLAAASRAGMLSEVAAETLSEALIFMLRLRLEQQLASLRSGRAPGSQILLDSISSLERRHLKEGLLFIRDLQDATSQRFDTAILG